MRAAGQVQCDLVSKMLQCLPSTDTDKVQQNPQLMAVLMNCDELERHLSACEVLVKYDMAPPFSFFKACEHASLAQIRASGGHIGAAFAVDADLNDAAFEEAAATDAAASLLLQVCKLGAGILDPSNALLTLPFHMAPSSAALSPWITVLQDVLQVQEYAFPWVSKEFCMRAVLFGLRGALSRDRGSSRLPNSGSSSLVRAIECLVLIVDAVAPEVFTEAPAAIGREGESDGKAASAVDAPEGQLLAITTDTKAQPIAEPVPEEAGGGWGWGGFGLIGGGAFTKALKSELTGLVHKITTTAEAAARCVV